MYCIDNLMISLSLSLSLWFGGCLILNSLFLLFEYSAVECWRGASAVCGLPRWLLGRSFPTDGLGWRKLVRWWLAGHSTDWALKWIGSEIREEEEEEEEEDEGEVEGEVEGREEMHVWLLTDIELDGE